MSFKNNNNQVITFLCNVTHWKTNAMSETLCGAQAQRPPFLNIFDYRSFTKFPFHPPLQNITVYHLRDKVQFTLGMGADGIQTTQSTTIKTCIRETVGTVCTLLDTCLDAACIQVAVLPVCCTESSRVAMSALATQWKQLLHAD